MRASSAAQIAWALASRRCTPASADGSLANRSSAEPKRVSSETRVSPRTSLSAS